MPYGTDHWMGKLNDAQVREIREAKGRITQRELAKRYGVVPSTISRIHHGVRRTRPTGSPHRRRSPEYCTIEGCSGDHLAQGLCAKHYTRLRKYGDPNHVGRRAKGEGTINRYGYRIVPVPFGTPGSTQRKGYAVMVEHRYVMQTYLNRPLRSEENVHHRNGVRSDNRLENLELWTRSQPQGKRISDLMEWARWILETYADEEAHLLELEP